MKSIELLDSWISHKIRNWSSRLAGEARVPELLEIRRELLNDVRDQIQPKGDGKLVFPYRSVRVRLAAATETQRESLETAFAQNDELQQDFASLLTEAGCPVPEGFHVSTEIIEDSALARTHRPFQIEYANPKAATALPASADVKRPPAKLIVLRGLAEPNELVINADKVYLGRLKEVVGESGALRRRNDIAFAETETSVSREHAFITYDRDTGAYRLHDSRNQRGTSIFRDSRLLRAPKGSVQGITLQSEDEIHLGEARLAFRIEDPQDAVHESGELQRFRERSESGA